MKYLRIALAALMIAGCATPPSAPPAAAPVPEAPPAVPAGPQYLEKSVQVRLPVQVRSLFSDGSLAGVVKTTYDAAGLLKREDSLNASGVLNEYRTGTVESGKVRISSFSNTGELQSLKVLTLGPRNRIEAEDLLNGKSVLQSQNSYSYDELDRVRTWTAKDGAGNILASTLYEYKNDLLDRIEVRDEKGSPLKVYQHLYNEKNLLTEKRELEATGTLAGVTLYTYNTEGLLVKEEVRNGQNVIQRMVEYTYAGNDSPAKVTYLDRRGKTTEVREMDYALFPKTIIERK